MSWGSSSSESGSSPQRVAGAMVAVVLSICGKRELRGVSSTSAEARLCLWL
jgi:stage V sporulation protein SpoVS